MHPIDATLILYKQYKVVLLVVFVIFIVCVLKPLSVLLWLYIGIFFCSSKYGI